MGKNLTVLVDMDGVIADFDAHFFDMCEREGFELHRGAVNALNPCTKHRFATDCIRGENRRKALTMVETDENWFFDIPPIPGAISGLERLAAHQDVAKIFLCTKPMRENVGCHDGKARWVRKYLGREWIDRLIITPNKGMVKGDILLDDAPKAEWFEIAEWVPVIAKMPWNAVGSPYCRRMGLASFLRWDWNDPIEDLLAAAKGPFE